MMKVLKHLYSLDGDYLSGHPVACQPEMKRAVRRWKDGSVRITLPTVEISDGHHAHKFVLVMDAETAERIGRALIAKATGKA